MATVEHTASGMFGKIPLGRRIAELMLEKGDAFSIRAFAERLSINRETFRLTLLGERPISISLLENIAKGLHITEERLRQLDTFKKQEDLEKLLKANSRTKVMLMRAHSIATELVAVSLGMTERCISFMNLGRVQFHQQQYDSAHESWLTAMEFAEKVYKEFEDSTLLYHVTSFLLLSYTIRKEYTNIQHILDVVENAFADDPEKMGYVQFTRMKWHEQRNNLEQAKDHAYAALDYFQKTNNKVQHGKALINVAHYEYLFGNYQESASNLLVAIEKLKGVDSILIIAVKEYAKTLLQLELYNELIQLVEEYSILASEYPDYMGKLQIMYTTATNDPSHAEAIVNEPKFSVNVRYLACKCLMEFYYLKRDADSAMRYYEKGRVILNTKSEYLNEGGF